MAVSSLPLGAHPPRPFAGAGPSSDLFNESVPASRNDLFTTSWTPGPPPPPLMLASPASASDLASLDTTTPRCAPTPLGFVSLPVTPTPTPMSLALPASGYLASPALGPTYIATSPSPNTLPTTPSPFPAAPSPFPTPSALPIPPPPLALQGAPPVSPPDSPDDFASDFVSSSALLARRLAAAKSAREPHDLEIKPPRSSSLSPASRSLSPSHLARAQETKYHSPLSHVYPLGDAINDPASRPPSPQSPPQPAAASSKTSSFFASAGADTLPPAPFNVPPPPSPLVLSRAASLRKNGDGKASPSSPKSATFRATYSPTHSHGTAHAPLSAPNLSPLHQSPSLAPQWVPAAPAADDVQLRLIPDPGYLLGEGRYATVFLASYKKSSVEGWKLCAAKRLAPDRESQTMGLREGFFLNRLGSGRGRGKVYCVKLITVKDDASPSVLFPGPSSPASPSTSSASTEQRSLLAETPPRRHRASTIFADGRGADPEVPGGHAGGPLPAATLPAPSRLVLVVEHAPLGTLDRLLRTSPGLVGPQLWGRWAREAASALEWVHGKGVVHADIKPSNLLLTTDLHLRLSDFGSSLLIHPDHPPTDGVGLGTLPFSPPELVDPSAPFSFPVDIFALGATLYQCLTGREPYRGSRPVEMMHYVRNGGLWSWAERDRLARVGSEGLASAAASPYPSAWRADPVPGAEVRRGGSLRVPHSHAHGHGAHATQHNHTQSLSASVNFEPSTPLRRVGSAESILASADAGRSEEDSPAGVRLWAAWHHGRQNGVDRLLSEQPTPPRSPVSRTSSLRSPLRHVSAPGPEEQEAPGLEGLGLEERVPASPTALSAPAYADGSPAMFFLGPGGEGATRVPDGVREMLRAMMEPAPEGRPCAHEVLERWDELGVGVGEEEEESEGGGDG